MGYGIEGIAFGGTLLTYLFYSCIVIGYALSHYTRQYGDWIRYFSWLWTPFIYMLILLGSVEMSVEYLTASASFKNVLFIAGAKVILYLIGCLPLIYIVHDRFKLDLSQASLSRLGILH
jgi:hypothetical protein